MLIFVILSKIMLSECHVLDESLRNEIDSVYWEGNGYWIAIEQP